MAQRTSRYSLVEVLVVIGILGLLGASTLLPFDGRGGDINSVAKTLLTDVEFTRTRAMTEGAHFVFAWSDDQRYEVRELKPVGAAWTVSKVVRRRTVPKSIRMSPTTAAFEFDTLGWMVSQDHPLNVQLTDPSGAAHRISIRPSGNVEYQ